MAEPATTTGARRELGRELAQLRAAAGYTQAELATAVGYSRSTVANIEAGRQAADEIFWEACDRVLGTGGALVAGYRQLREFIARQHREAAEAARRNRHAAVLYHDEGAVDTVSRGAEGVVRQTLGTMAGTEETEPTRFEQRVMSAYREMRQTPSGLSLTLVGGYAGSGKSEFARFLSAVTGWSILDKDTLTRPLVEQLLISYGSDPNDRDTEIYLQKVRPHEYRCLMDAASENLRAGVSTVLTAPFLREYKDEAWLRRIQNRCTGAGATLVIIWVTCDVESMFDYVSYRGAARDAWKIANWEEYLEGVDVDFRPNVPHYVVDNKLNAAVALADQARDIAMRVQA